MEIIYVNPNDIFPSRVSHFNTLEEKFFSFKSNAEQPSSLEEILREILAKKILPWRNSDLLFNPILMAHIAYITKGNFIKAGHEFNLRHLVYKLYSPQEKHMVLSSTLVSDWDSIIKKEYPDLEYVSLENFWNLFSNNQIEYKEKVFTDLVQHTGDEIC